ncbi:MAG: DUF4358 domain-containing protein [Clostridiales bacterium]|nr:DUF4358 domain-containing protein [Clostridiales bacterium]
MKRFIAVFLAAGLLLGGCGGSEETAETEASTETETEAQTEEESESEAESETAEQTTSAETQNTTAEETTAAVTEAPTAAPAEAQTEAPVLTEKTVLSCGELYTKCVESGNFVELVACDSDYVMNYFGIDTTALKGYAVGEALEAIKADALLLFEANSESEAAEIKAKMDDYLTRKQNELENYNAEGYKKAAAGIVGSSGNYVYVIICENSSAVLNIIEENI